MVKRSRVLDEVAQEAEVPYESTRLARRALKARPRLFALLLLGAAGFALEAAIARQPLWLVGAAFIGAGAWGVRAGRLGGTIAAALVCLLALLLPLGLALVGPRERADVVLGAFVVAWGASLMPDVLTLVRDAELQHAYGRWARR